MQQPLLDTIVASLVKPRHREQRDLARAILEQVAQGKPVEKSQLSAALHLSLEELEQRLVRLPDLEYDAQGNLVGSGLTLVPTTHQFQIGQQTLFIWCAFDTLTYPVDLHLSARITSQCPVTGQTIRLTVMPEQILDLDPRDAQVSLKVSVAAECCSQNVREDVCNHGHFFASPEAAAWWKEAHPEVLILNVAEAYQVGKLGTSSNA